MAKRTKQYRIRLNEEEYEDLCQLSKVTGLSKADAIRVSIKSLYVMYTEGISGFIDKDFGCDFS